MPVKSTSNTSKGSWAQSPFVQNLQVLGKSRFLPAVILLVVIIVGVVGVKLVMIIAELHNLSWASQRLDYAVAAIERDHTADHALHKSRSCYYIESTPYNNGRLRCAVGFTLTVTGKNRDAVSDRGADLLTVLGSPNVFGDYLKTAADNGGRFQVAEPGLYCHVNNSWDTPLQSQTAAEDIAVACDTDAIWQFYPIK